MKIIEASAVLVDEIDSAAVMKKLELCGRVSRKSEGKITATSADEFIRKIIGLGHESVLEHVSVTFKVVCDRGVMAELTRHRLASFTVESTRYCDYSSDRFGGELTFIKPCYWKHDALGIMLWERGMRMIEEEYLQWRKCSGEPEQDRAILPMSLATTLYMTANLREWRHILKLRTAPAAHPQMREVMLAVLKILKAKLPVVFEDIGEEI